MQHRKDSIAVLDDHSLILDAIANMVNNNADYTFAGGFEAATGFADYIRAEGAPTFLLLDINLAGDDGLALCKSFSKAYPDMKIIMLTGLQEPAIIRSAVKSGCAGFMLKNMKAEELWECLEKIKQGDRYLHASVEKILLQNAVNVSGNNAEYIPRLSRREKEVLDLIVKEMTTQEIAGALFISVNTVETHRASLLSKLGARNIAGLVKMAIEKGLV